MEDTKLAPPSVCVRVVSSFGAADDTRLRHVLALSAPLSLLHSPAQSPSAAANGMKNGKFTGCLVGDPCMFKLKVPRDVNAEMLAVNVHNYLVFELTKCRLSCIKVYKARSRNGGLLTATDEDIAALTQYGDPVPKRVRRQYLIKNTRVCED